MPTDTQSKPNTKPTQTQPQWKGNFWLTTTRSIPKCSEFLQKKSCPFCLCLKTGVILESLHGCLDSSKTVVKFAIDISIEMFTYEKERFDIRPHWKRSLFWLTLPTAFWMADRILKGRTQTFSCLHRKLFVCTHGHTVHSTCTYSGDRNVVHMLAWVAVSIRNWVFTSR